MQEINRILNKISSHVASRYQSWMEIGWILYDLTNGNNEGLDSWIRFSRKSQQFIGDQECKLLWEKMVLRNIYTMRSLLFMAQRHLILSRCLN